MSAKNSSQDHRKPCTLCHQPRDVLVRCQIDSTEAWHFVCPGKCWKNVSGGVIDGDKSEQHEWYRYGGMWKNKHEAVSAKKPKHRRSKGSRDEQAASARVDASTDEEAKAAKPWNGSEQRYVRNDKVEFEDQLWMCRKTHCSDERKPPSKAYSLWKDIPSEIHTAG